MMFRRSVIILALAIVAAPTAADAAADDSSSHYEKPPCQNSDEKAVQIMGIDGMFCSASCKDSPCPSDTPNGVTATPSCALQSPQGDKYCAILCSPSSEEEEKDMESSGDGECGPMMCQPIPQAAGLGICTYTSRIEEEEPAMIFMEEDFWMMAAEE